MGKLLPNAKLASAVGFLILIALIWLVGPFVGLASPELRLSLIVVVMVIWVAALLVGRVITDRAGGLLEKVLRRQADDAVIGATADQRRDVAQLRQRLLGAIDTLKTSQLGKASGKAALYELPWYMVIGHAAAGKSSAILYSGLDFPFGDKQAIQGVGGTRNCDWFFTTEGVLLDTAGRYSTQLTSPETALPVRTSRSSLSTPAPGAEEPTPKLAARFPPPRPPLRASLPDCWQN